MDQWGTFSPPSRRPTLSPETRPFPYVVVPLTYRYLSEPGTGGTVWESPGFPKPRPSWGSVRLRSSGVVETRERPDSPVGSRSRFDRPRRPIPGPDPRYLSAEEWAEGREVDCLPLTLRASWMQRFTRGSVRSLSHQTYGAGT